MYDNVMTFYSLIDFYPKREIIKDNFDLLSLDDKIMYKMYVYSLPFMDDNTKDLIWEYINGWEEGKFDLAKKYREAKKKYDKRKESEMKEVINDNI